MIMIDYFFGSLPWHLNFTLPAAAFWEFNTRSMKVLFCALLLCSFATSSMFAGRGSGGGGDDWPASFKSSSKKGKKAYTPPPTPTPPPAPSVDLTKFVSTNSDKLFGPADMHPPLPKAELAQMRASFSERFGKAGLADRQQYQYAIAACDALSQVMTEKATTPSVAAWNARTPQLKQWVDQLLAQEKTAETAAATPK